LLFPHKKESVWCGVCALKMSDKKIERLLVFVSWGGSTSYVATHLSYYPNINAFVFSIPDGNKEEVYLYSVAVLNYYTQSRAIHVTCKDFNRVIIEVGNDEDFQNVQQHVDLLLKKSVNLKMEYDVDVISEYLYDANLELSRQGYIDDKKNFEDIYISRKTLYCTI